MLQREDTIAFEITSKGQNSDCMQIVCDFYSVLNTSLDNLINQTLTFLENAKDGFIDVDEKSAETFDRLKNEVIPQ